MKLVDANVLLYSVNEDAPRHGQSQEWARRRPLWSSNRGLRMGRPPCLHPAVHQASLILKSALAPAEAIQQVEDWLAQPSAVVVEPTARHLDIVRELLGSLGTGGNLVNDAHLAALAIEHRCQVVSFDHDFARFAGVKLEIPA